MQAAATRMRALINDLLTFSRLTTKPQPIVTVDLGPLARVVVCDLEGRIQQTGGRVEVGDLPTVEADPLQIRQLLQNLIGNGLKFHRPGEPPVVKVEGRVLSGAGHPVNGNGRRDPLCMLTVADNGIGFEEIYLDRIFEVFQRLHARHVTTHGKPVTILMADDDADDRQMTKDAFVDSRIANDLRFVENGLELMDYLKRRGKYSDPADSPRPGLILLDLNMPKKDGREALEEIKPTRI